MQQTLLDAGHDVLNSRGGCTALHLAVWPTLGVEFADRIPVHVDG